MTSSRFKKALLTDLTLWFLIAGALSASLVFFGVGITRAGERVRQSYQELLSQSFTIISGARLRTQYVEKAEPALRVLYTFIPTQDELIDLTKEFRLVAGSFDLGFGFTFLGEMSPAAGEPLGSANFSISLQGTNQDQLFQFMQKLERFRYFLTVESVAMNSQGARNEMTIRGRVFFRE